MSNLSQEQFPQARVSAFYKAAEGSGEYVSDDQRWEVRKTAVGARRRSPNAWSARPRSSGFVAPMTFPTMRDATSYINDSPSWAPEHRLAYNQIGSQFDSGYLEAGGDGSMGAGDSGGSV